MTRKIKIDKITDVKKFVEIATKYGDNLIVKNKTTTCPACSLMSILSLIDISSGAKLVFDEDWEENVIADFGEWFEDDAND